MPKEKSQPGLSRDFWDTIYSTLFLLSVAACILAVFAFQGLRVYLCFVALLGLIGFVFYVIVFLLVSLYQQKEYHPNMNPYLILGLVWVLLSGALFMKEKHDIVTGELAPLFAEFRETLMQYPSNRRELDALNLHVFQVLKRRDHLLDERGYLRVDGWYYYRNLDPDSCVWDKAFYIWTPWSSL